MAIHRGNCIWVAATIVLQNISAVIRFDKRIGERSIQR